MKKHDVNILTSTIVLAAMLFMGGVKATEQDEFGNYIWTFLSGQPWPGGYNQNTGKPTNLTYARDEYSSEFFQRINNALPERELNEAFITDDAGSTIHLTEEAEVFVTFIHEGAGYRNSFGYFVFDPANPPTTHQEVNEIIVFPNLSYPHMTNGHRLSLGTFPADTHIGFFIAANGYYWWTGVKDFKAPYYYSLQDLNPEFDPSLRQHTVLLYDEEVSEVIIGFEDLPRTWGDNDFNDAVFSVKSTPETAISSTNLVAIPAVNDSDADGVDDNLDEFPNDFNRAYSSYYPNSESYVTLAYEDNWPKVGDYDFNDLVIKERLQTTYNADGQVSGFILHGLITARGASHRNGFALRLMDVAPELIGEANIVIDGQTFEKFAEEFQTDAVIPLWQDSHLFTTTGETGQCTHFNTNKSCSYFEPVQFTLDVEFTSTLTSLNHSELDFFIFRTNDRSLEVHFADYPPTDLFDYGRFGRQADSSSIELNRYFKSAQNLPWGLKINAEWNYPREYIDVLWAYPDFETWVESSGSQATDWYMTSDRKSHYYLAE